MGWEYIPHYKGNCTFCKKQMFLLEPKKQSWHWVCESCLKRDEALKDVLTPEMRTKRYIDSLENPLSTHPDILP